MDHEVAAAIPPLREKGLLPDPIASRLLRIARGELLSIRWEMRFLLYAGVLLVTSGVGLLVRQNYAEIGPVAVAAAIGLASAVCLLWVARAAPPFSPGEVASPNLAFDYILLLGVLLGGATLAFVEWQLTPLGRDWPWHLLVVSLLTAAAAFRWDSSVVFSLSLTTFAAWRGVSTAFLERAAWGEGANPVRWNAIGVGVAFVALGFLLVRGEWKAHFEPVAAHVGWLLLLGGLASWLNEEEPTGAVAAVALAATSALLGRYAWLRSRFSLFALGAIGGWAAVTFPVGRHLRAGTLGCAWVLVTSIAAIVLLSRARRRLRRSE
jgi:hypothetical protein